MEEPLDSRPAHVGRRPTTHLIEPTLPNHVSVFRLLGTISAGPALHEDPRGARVPPSPKGEEEPWPRGGGLLVGDAFRRPGAFELPSSNAAEGTPLLRAYTREGPRAMQDHRKPYLETERRNAPSGCRPSRV